MDDLNLERDRGIATLLLLHDLSAAFDAIDHGIVLVQLSVIGIRGTVVPFIASQS